MIGQSYIKLSIMTSLIIFTSCAGYNVRSGFQSPPTCYQSYNPTFKSLEDCQNSKTYKQLIANYESDLLYRIYDRGYSLGSNDRFYCGSKNDIENMAARTSPVSEKEFTLLDDCNKSAELKNIRSNFKAKIIKNVKAAESKRTEQIDKYIKSNPSASKFREAAIGKKIQLGMPEELVYYSWGKPQKTNNSVGSYGVHKQLVYGNSTYVYIEDGKVSSWQN